MGEIKITNKDYTDGALYNHYRATRALRLGLVPEYHIPIHFYIRRRSYSYATRLAVARQVSLSGYPNPS